MTGSPSVSKIQNYHRLHISKQCNTVQAVIFEEVKFRGILNMRIFVGISIRGHCFSCFCTLSVNFGHLSTKCTKA